MHTQHLGPITETARKVRRAARHLDELLGSAATVLGRVRADGRTELTAAEAGYLARLDAELRTVIEGVHRLAVERHSWATTAREG